MSVTEIRATTVLEGVTAYVEEYHPTDSNSVILTTSEAVVKEIREQYPTLLVCTFNAFLYGVLLQHKIFLTLIPESDRARLVKDIATTHDLLPEELSSRITAFKLGNLREKNPHIQEYIELIKADGRMDMDDMTLYFAEQLDKDSLLRERIHLVYNNIFLADYDTLNSVQKKILRVIDTAHMQQVVYRVGSAPRKQPVKKMLQHGDMAKASKQPKKSQMSLF